MLTRIRLFLVVALMLVFTLAVTAFAADPAPAVAATTTGLAPALDWVNAHQAIIGVLLIAVLDFVFALNPKWESNGGLHMLYLLGRKLSGRA